MVVPAGGAWLAVHVLLLLLVSMAATSASWSGSVSVSDNVSDSVSDNVTAAHWGPQQLPQADMPAGQRQSRQDDLRPYYGEGTEAGEGAGDSMLADDSSRHQFQTGR